MEKVHREGQAWGAGGAGRGQESVLVDGAGDEDGECWD